MTGALSNIRLVEGHGSWPVHVVGPGNATLVGPTVAMAAMGDDGLSEKAARAAALGALRLYDFLVDPARGIDVDAAPATIVGGAKAYLRAQGLKVSRDGAHPWWRVSGDDAVVSRVKSEFAGARRQYDAMIDAGLYDFGHPLELGEEQMRLMRLRAVRSGSGRRFSRAVLSAALFRFDHVSYKPPRRTQVALVRDAVASAEAAGWWEGRVLYLRILNDGAPRPKEATRFTMLDAYRASRFGERIWSTSKGHGDRRIKIVQVRPETAAGIRDFIDGARRRARPGALSLAKYQALGDAGEHDRLAAEPLLVEEDGRGLDYDRLARAFRRDVADLVVDPVTGRAPLRRPTLHWFRHLFCYDMLALIHEARLSPEEELSRKQLLVAYMFWSTGLKMLACYGREFEDLKLAEHLAAAMGRRELLSRALADGSIGPARAGAAIGAAAAPSAPVAAMFRDRRADASPPVARRAPPRR